MLAIIGIIIIAALAVYGVFRSINKSNKWIDPPKDFPPDWRAVLEKEVLFYSNLSDEDKLYFEQRVHGFLLNYKITPIQTTIDLKDKLLVASSAIIPIFHFPNWRYTNLKEVLIYPARFNLDYDTEGENRNILGMVGNGILEGKMVLSKKALEHGFSNKTDKGNTAIHEFIHLVDKMDGAVDGIPKALMDKKLVLPWLEVMHKEIENIQKGESDIRSYATTNQQEFLAVCGEYFFERPHLFERKHPELFAIMDQVFNPKKGS